MFSYFEPISFKKNGQNRNDAKQKHLFAAIFKRYNIFFCRIMIFIMHTYMVQISLLNSSGKVVFRGWLNETPLGTNEVKVNWSI